MSKESAAILVGTSGWTYASWRGRFYPPELKSQQFLEFYAKEFPTTEINYSFYHLPKPQTYAKWAQQVPAHFLFAVKASRFITHIKRLQDVHESWRIFVENARALGPHLGPILLQFPPSFSCDLQRLEAFLMFVCERTSGVRVVCEFRHESWFDRTVYRLLKRYHVALCIADSPRYPRADVITTDFAYYRYHGRTELFASCYSDTELREEAKLITRAAGACRTVFVYFNNDAYGYAVDNARTLRQFLTSSSLAE
ncbi:MAG: DUF72 domain-containing protein [Nitrospirae bacterium]|nr:MAG: DUF72 domain-containing protein [Nitrospirota bacterium]